jgi:hypothetical protein
MMLLWGEQKRLERNFWPQQGPLFLESFINVDCRWFPQASNIQFGVLLETSMCISGLMP